MSATRLETEPILFADAEIGAGSRTAGGSRAWWRHVRRWWRQETTPLVEDEAIGADSLQGRPIRLVLPLVLPVLTIAALVVLREPDNIVGVICLAFGAVAIGYGVLADGVEQRSERGAVWIPLVNTAVYAAIISIELWCFLTIEHPRPYAHWIIFFLYFLLIGAAGLSDDPKQPVCAGIFSILGYGIVMSLFTGVVEAGSSEMAAATAPQFEWAGNAAKMALLGGATFTGAASAHRGRAVRRLSLRDGLTGLLNRRAFDRCLAHLARQAEQSELPMTIAMIDIDHFKRLNDVHGHQTGDAVLRWTGAWLQRSFRTTDVVSRYGGEEFVVAFVDSGDVEVLTGRLEALRAGIARTTLRASGTDQQIRVTVSIGIAQVPLDGSDLDAVLARADERLYLAKQAGRNRVEAGPAVRSADEAEDA